MLHVSMSDVFIIAEYLYIQYTVHPKYSDSFPKMDGSIRCWVPVWVVAYKEQSVGQPRLHANPNACRERSVQWAARMRLTGAQRAPAADPCSDRRRAIHTEAGCRKGSVRRRCARRHRRSEHTSSLRRP
ncbi:hypothetical protein QCA50_019167 [Cerrena zonata]|uniref:Uncharacterized protein n=1 Tax=Cerrena zonata TaxID=2478898 RepID=A0AAW0FFK4_9APHY